MDISEEIRRINQFFKAQKQKENSLLTQQAENRKALDREISKVKSQLQAAIMQIAAEREEVMVYCRIAENNTARRAGQNGSKAVAPNINQLAALARKIDSSNYNDPYAAQIIALTECALTWFRHQEADLGRQEQIKIDALKHKYLRPCSTGNTQEIRDFFQDKRIAQLRTTLDQVKLTYGFDASRLRNHKWLTGSKIPFGYLSTPMEIPEALQPQAEDALGGHYWGGEMSVPVGIRIGTDHYLSAEYTPSVEGFVQNGVRGLFINLFLRLSQKYMQVAILDSIHYNASLLGDMASAADGLVAPIPRNEAQLQSRLRAMAETCQREEQEAATGKKPDSRIRLLILNHRESARWRDSPEMTYLLSNAAQLRLLVVELICKDPNGRGGSVGFVPRGGKSISYQEGTGFYVQTSAGRQRFKWLEAPMSVPKEFLDFISRSNQKQKKGPNYFHYFPQGQLPQKSTGKRRPITVPFARDENEEIISCSFENENFAAYMMGASSSGKSTLLHVMICSLLTRYHPDEVELWLVDLKRTEFRRYARMRTPHIRYLLLENSDDLVFDLIEELTEELDRRMRLFAEKGWSKHGDVPTQVHMPAVFVIIDEFAQVSQKLHESSLSGGVNYEQELENLLAKGRAFGFKFIFASQSYESGVRGLTAVARNQIQVRFALKNTASEITSTLDLVSTQKTENLMREITGLQVYETLFKHMDPRTGQPVIEKYYNLMVDQQDQERELDLLARHFRPGTVSTDSTYIDKHPVYLVDDAPRTFDSLLPLYRRFEATMASNRSYGDADPEDVLIYPGVPCGFHLAKPIVMKKLAGQNTLIVGGSQDEQTSLLRSFLRSWKQHELSLQGMEIWSSEQYPVYTKYKAALQKYGAVSDIRSIVDRVEALPQEPPHKRMILCLGLDMLYDDFADERDYSTPAPSSGLYLWDILNDPNLTPEKLDQYNKSTGTPAGGQRDLQSVDFQAMMKKLIERGGRRGIHFVFFFMNGSACGASQLPVASCAHKLLFPMPRIESKTLAGVDTSEVPEGVATYTNGCLSFHLKPHIYPGVPCGGWILQNGRLQRR